MLDAVVQVDCRLAALSGGTKEEIAGDGDAFAGPAPAQQPVERQPGNLADDVPASQFDGDGLGYVAQPLHQGQVVAGVLAQDKRLDDLLEQAQLFAVGYMVCGGDARLAHAGDAFVRVQPDEGAQARRVADAIGAEDGRAKGCLR